MNNLLNLENLEALRQLSDLLTKDCPDLSLSDIIKYMIDADYSQIDLDSYDRLFVVVQRNKLIFIDKELDKELLVLEVK